MLALAGATVLLGISSSDSFGQQDRPRRGDFDPEQFRARMAERTKEMLGVTDDAEWKVIQPRVEKVMEARREAGGFGGGFGGPGAFGRGPRGGGDDEGGRRGPGGAGGGRGFGPEPSAAVQDLQKAIEGNASADEIKAKLAKVREERKQKEAALAKAREDLKQVLSVKQEANAVLMGLVE